MSERGAPLHPHLSSFVGEQRKGRVADHSDGRDPRPEVGDDACRLANLGRETIDVSVERVIWCLAYRKKKKKITEGRDPRPEVQNDARRLANL